jgi:hypothetical protein
MIDGQQDGRVLHTFSSKDKKKTWEERTVDK